MMEEKSLQDSLKRRAEKEEKYFDIALSGTTATIVI